MKSLSKFVVAVCACTLGCSIIAETDQSQADSDVALDTIAIINHINYAVEVIRTYNNVAALEDEYEKISADNLNLNCIRDEETLQLVRDTLNTLNNMRMNDRARKWYRHLLARDLESAKLDAIAKMVTTVTSSLVNGSGSIRSQLGQVAKATVVAGVESIADYKKVELALQGQLEDKQFELDTDKLNELHKMNEMLLVRQWTLINKYRIDDRLRITGENVAKLVQCLKGSDKKNTFHQLKPMRGVFEVYPTYWYYRAAMAIAIEDYKDALASCEHFEKINRRIFRNDQMAANVAMIKITAMLKLLSAGKALDPTEITTVKNGLEAICRQNYSLGNADQGVFCTLVYFYVLNDVDAAISVLDPLMAKLDADLKDELKEYCDLFTSSCGKKTEILPNTVYLAQCRMLRIAIDKTKEHKIHVERLREICCRETTCCLEKLFYFGELRIEDLWELAEKDIEKINLMMQGDSLVIEIPVAWFLLGKLETSVELLNGTNIVEMLSDVDSRRSHVMSSSHFLPFSRDMAYVRVVMAVNKDVIASCTGVRLKIKHGSWPVELVYSPEKSLKEDNVYFVPTHVERFMGKNLNRTVMSDPMAKAKKEFEDLKSKAEQGDAKAQLNIGMMYANSYGVAQDKTEAVKWFRKSADQGFAEAQYHLGKCYHEGFGVVADKAEAVRCFTKAANRGFAEAQYHLGNYCMEASRLPMLYKTTLIADLVSAAYEKYNDDMKKKRAEAVTWYHKAAEQGHVAAQYKLGSCYENGYGVKKDKDRAKEWYRRAAEQGHKEAKKRLSKFKSL